jgi:hypothetical protein
MVTRMVVAINGTVDNTQAKASNTTEFRSCDCPGRARPRTPKATHANSQCGRNRPRSSCGRPRGWRESQPRHCQGNAQDADEKRKHRHACEASGCSTYAQGSRGRHWTNSFAKGQAAPSQDVGGRWPTDADNKRKRSSETAQRTIMARKGKNKPHLGRSTRCPIGTFARTYGPALAASSRSTRCSTPVTHSR